MSNYRIVRPDELYHHGILGQKWGVRRFQNSDGSLTSEGKRRYSERLKSGKKYSQEREQIVEKKSLDFFNDPDKQADYFTKSFDLYPDDDSLSSHLNNVQRYARIDAIKYANDELIKKYGSVSVDDANLYEATAMGAAFSALALGIIGAFAIERL